MTPELLELVKSWRARANADVKHGLKHALDSDREYYGTVNAGFEAAQCADELEALVRGAVPPASRCTCSNNFANPEPVRCPVHEGAVPPASQEPVIRLSRPLAAAPLISDEEWPDWVGDCAKWRGELLVGQDAHWCGDWDGLPVDETSREYDCCQCFDSDSVFYQGRPKGASQGPAPARKEP